MFKKTIKLSPRRESPPRAQRLKTRRMAETLSPKSLGAFHRLHRVTHTTPKKVRTGFTTPRKIVTPTKEEKAKQIERLLRIRDGKKVAGSTPRKVASPTAATKENTLQRVNIIHEELDSRLPPREAELQQTLFKLQNEREQEELGCTLMESDINRSIDYLRNKTESRKSAIRDVVLKHEALKKNSTLGESMHVNPRASREIIEEAFHKKLRVLFGTKVARASEVFEMHEAKIEGLQDTLYNYLTKLKRAETIAYAFKTNMECEREGSQMRNHLEGKWKEAREQVLSLQKDMISNVVLNIERLRKYR